MNFKNKVKNSKEIIKCWYESWDGKVYISFSGGKDSTVLLHLVRSIYPNVPALFINTGLEFPEIVRFVNTIDNVHKIRPKKPFHQILNTYGYPVISKEQSQYLYEIRTTKSEKLYSLRMNSKNFSLSKKWKYLINAPFKISDRCCYYLKKEPAKRFEKETGLHPYIGIMNEESNLRLQQYNRFGCNSYELKRPISKPLSLWSEKDIWKYIKKYNLRYSKIYDMGYNRTGCMFCLYGVHLENEPNRFQKMKKTHPKQWRFCMKKLKIKKVLKYMGIKRK